MQNKLTKIRLYTTFCVIDGETYVLTFKGLDIDCGCGLAEKTTPFDRLKEDIALLLAAFIIKFRDRIRTFLNINS